MRQQIFISNLYVDTVIKVNTRHIVYLKFGFPYVVGMIMCAHVHIRLFCLDMLSGFKEEEKVPGNQL